MAKSGNRKLGTVLTMRGVAMSLVGNHKLNLFDGRYDTGFKLISFEVVPQNPQGDAQEASAMLFNRKQAGFLTVWDFADVEQVGWSGWSIPTANRFGVWNRVDDETILVEDIFLAIYAPGEARKFNYIIKLQKYDITEWEGALSLVSRKG